MTTRSHSWPSAACALSTLTCSAPAVGSRAPAAAFAARPGGRSARAATRRQYATGIGRWRRTVPSPRRGPGRPERRTVRHAHTPPASDAADPSVATPPTRCSAGLRRARDSGQRRPAPRVPVAATAPGCRKLRRRPRPAPTGRRIPLAARLCRRGGASAAAGEAKPDRLARSARSAGSAHARRPARRRWRPAPSAAPSQRAVRPANPRPPRAATGTPARSNACDNPAAARGTDRTMTAICDHGTPSTRCARRNESAISAASAPADAASRTSTEPESSPLPSISQPSASRLASLRLPAPRRERNGVTSSASPRACRRPAAPPARRRGSRTPPEPGSPASSVTSAPAASTRTSKAACGSSC